ncbi:sensor histidine kinase [Allorhizocola rhizosphaerae]|uniref:sensor histidine kinase n=1 Tax=Allorhizocola rhizosphaerae TaxID=1872709 RepID=UPI0013C32E07|nr:HAMP domain-containing sensor histidine kinase [Allorhizocola rhizosphaerae]
MKSPRRWSLRTRLLVGVLSVVALGFSFAGFASAHLLRDYLSEQVDEQLYQARERILLMDPSKLDEGITGYVVQYRDPSGRVYGDEFEVEEPQRDKVFYEHGSRHHPGYHVLMFDHPSGGTVLVAYDLTGLGKTVRKFIKIEFTVMLTVLGLSALLGVMMVRVGLRPLNEVEQTAEEIVAGGDLSRRVPTLAGPDTEMGRLSRTLNTMLDTIEGSMIRLRRFIADASHELRTPVTGIRGLAELYRQGAVTDAAETRALIARIEAEATRMGVLVEDLLLLARLDEERPLRFEAIDLVPIAADAIEGHLVDLELVGDADPVVLGDEDRLRQVVTNLVTNALAHTPTGTPITVRVGVDGGQALLEVADRGPGIAAEHGDRVFERFYRVDPARARDHERSPSTGSGLGLSIVKALVTAHGGTVGHRPTPGGGATFWVLLPLIPAAPQTGSLRARPRSHEDHGFA